MKTILKKFATFLCAALVLCACSDDDYSEAHQSLMALIRQAESLVEESTEGIEEGDTAPGSKKALQARIDQAYYIMNNTSRDEGYRNACKQLEEAIKAFRENGGSITIIDVTTLSGGDITHAIPDNTGYITEGQLFLRNDSATGKVIVDPFRSLSRLKQLVIGKKTREDHPQVMNACVRLYADAANAKTKLENGFDLSDYDERTLKFAFDYSEKLLSIDVNIGITEMLDTAWGLFAKYFSKEEVAIKEELIKKYWKEA